MNALVRSPLVEARTMRRAYHVTVAVGGDYPELRWRRCCVGCGVATSRCERRQSSAISRGEWKNIATTRYTAKVAFVSIPLCETCSSKERREQVLWRSMAATLAALVVLAMLAALWPELSRGHPDRGALIGLAFLAVMIWMLVFRVGIRFRPIAWVGVTPTWGTHMTIVFRRRDAARELIKENASNEGEASDLMEQLEGGAR